ncbi:MAG: RNA polymerase sigma factor [Acidobacteria bacterium]|nr:MAG: RNA polymerase sigma factor [Acidobacteriota bacterium]
MRELRGVNRIAPAQDSRESENRLILDAASGDVTAFAEIYRRYRDRLYGFIYRMTPAGAYAEDLTHDVFLTLLEHPERYDPAKGSLLTFLCAIARCRVVDQIRKNGTRAEKELWTDEDAMIPLGGEAAITPFDKLLKAEIEDLVVKAVMALPPLQRETLLLREYEGLSYEEIALVVKGSVGIVKARLYRARQLVAARLAPLINTNGEHEYELRKSRA